MVAEPLDVAIVGYGDPGAELEPELAAFFRSLGGVTAHVGPGGPVADLRHGYARWFAEHGVAVALQRPDFQVFGSAQELADAPALVAELRVRLGAPPTGSARST